MPKRTRVTGKTKKGKVTFFVRNRQAKPSESAGEKGSVMSAGVQENVVKSCKSGDNTCPPYRDEQSVNPAPEKPKCNHEWVCQVCGESHDWLKEKKKKERD